MLDQLNNLSCYFEVEVICDLYLLHFIVLLNPVFNCSKSFESFSFDKVTTGTYNFVSVILNVVPDGATIAVITPAFTVISATTQFLDQVKINSTSQLFSGISKLLQKLLKCFSGLTTFAFVNESLIYGFSYNTCLVFKRSELEGRGSLGSSL